MREKKPPQKKRKKSFSSTENIERETTTAFLLAEYERLRDIRNELSQRASRRFEFFLTITSAAVGAYLIILNQSEGALTIPRYLVDIFAVLFLGYGLITFMNVTFASTFDIQIVRAVRQIQQYFIILDPNAENHLYFSSPHDPPNRYRFLRVLARGVGGGSEKSVIAFINSSLIAYLIVSFLINYVLVRTTNNSLIVVGIVAFLISALLHATYVTLMYQYSKASQ